MTLSTEANLAFIAMALACLNAEGGALSVDALLDALIGGLT